MLIANSFLSTRVRRPTEQDMSKLTRVLKYLNGANTLGLSIRGETVVCVCAYIDASYAVHDDFKLQSGLIISLGAGTLLVRSTKQPA